MPIRISDPSGYATYSAIASGLNWAADRGARVAKISFIVSGSSAVKSAAQYFQNKGGVVVAAAGNYSTFDSAADNPYILTVSATNISDQHSDPETGAAALKPLTAKRNIMATASAVKSISLTLQREIRGVVPHMIL